MFSKKVLNSSAVKLWNQLDLKDKKTGNQFRISDMQFIGDDLYVLSCCKNNNPVEGRLCSPFRSAVRFCKEFYENETGRNSCRYGKKNYCYYI